MQSPSRRPAPPPVRPLPPLGLTPDPQSLRQWQAQRYHFEALRRLGPAPAPLPASPRLVSATRDGDLARMDARMRYERQLVARQQYLAQHPRPLPQAYMSAPEYAPDYEQQQQVLRRLEQQHAQLVADHPLEATVGEGVVIGSNIVTSTLLSEVAAARLLTGARWLGATRAGLAVQRVVGTGAARAGLAVRGATWAGAGEEAFGLGASIKQYKPLTFGQGARLTMARSFLDFSGQGVGNYLSGNKSGLDGAFDAAYSVNLVETTAAGINMRPLGLGLTSGMLQYSVKAGFRTPLDGSLSWRAFGAQAGLAAGFGYLTLGAGHLLNKQLAYSLYSGAAARWGQDTGYLFWAGSTRLFYTGVPVGIGGATTLLQNKADSRWSITAPPSNLP